MAEHNGGTDHVTWRDLDTARDRLLVELERRFGEHGRQHDKERSADQEALRLAREDLMKALANTNNFREEATADKLKYAETNFVNTELAKLEASIRTDYGKEVATLSGRISALATSASGTSGDVRKLQDSGNVAQGSDKGNLALIISIAAILLSIAGNVGARLIFG